MAFMGSEGRAADSDDSFSQIQERSNDQTEAEQGLECKTQNGELDERYVPDFILEEILVRLPAKFVFRSKCAYKKWIALTATPSFIRSYFLHWQGRFENSPMTRPWTFLYWSTYDDPSNQIAEERKLRHVYSLDYSSPRLSALASLSHGRMQIIAESNGLLLCYQFDANKYYVCNPISNQWVALPDMPGGRHLIRRRSRLPFFSRLSESRLNMENTEALATQVEDGLVTRYKVVVPRGCLHFVVFSSDTGEWISFTPACDPPNPLHSACLSKPVAVGGLLYWPDHLRGVLLAYDAFGQDNTSARLLSLPRAHIGDGYSRMCGVSGGFLRYYELHEMEGSDAFRVWELEDFMSGTWSVKHERSWNDVCSSDEDLTATLTEMVRFPAIYFAPLAFHPYDPDTIYLHNGKYIVSYSFQKRRLDVLHDPRACFPELTWPTERSWFNVMPFPFPLWPSPVPETACTATGAV